MPTAVHPRPHRPPNLWPRTIRLGLVTTVVAVSLAVVVRVLTPVPTVAIVILAALVAFTLSWHVTYPAPTALPSQQRPGPEGPQGPDEPDDVARTAPRRRPTAA